MSMPEIALTLQPLELAEGGGGVLVKAVANGLGLLRLANQDSVAPEHHGHVLDLVPVDPSQDLGPARVSAAVGDSVHADQCRSLSLALRHPHPPPCFVVLLSNGSLPKHCLSVQLCTEVSLYLFLL
uniref:Uncharacterized protein n=1 Tax=Sander lucioperca TaxID=283035 RepID=A0A8C9YP88_SANLU